MKAAKAAANAHVNHVSLANHVSLVALVKPVSHVLLAKLVSVARVIAEQPLNPSKNSVDFLVG